MKGKLISRAGQWEVEPGADGKPKHRGSGKDLSYFDTEAWERDKERLKTELGVSSFQQYVKKREAERIPGAPYQYVPHVIEPSAGADRGTLAFLCEAYCEDTAPDENGKPQDRVVMKFHPRLAPIKAAVFPLVKKDGMPEVAQKLYLSLKKEFVVFYDDGGAVGRRYRRQDEIGTPFCITVDGDTLKDQTVTIRERDTLKQRRIHLDAVADELHKLLG
jgi:glycyl-tRNA synthetase